jgi:hypothetical protein
LDHLPPIRVLVHRHDRRVGGGPVTLAS